MTEPALSRRTLLKGGSAALAGMSVLRLTGPASAFQGSGEVIPWLDQPDENPVPEVIVQQLVWEDLDSWITPNEDFFVIKHFAEPVMNDAEWTLEISGLVDTPMTLTLADLQAREQIEVIFTMECSGNTGLPFFTGGIGNAAWGGISLAALLNEAGIQEAGKEIVFWGADSGEQVWREVTITEQFARSMSVDDALSPDNMIALQMNGEPLPPLHGYPARLIAPGWYGVANVKWLTRIEVRAARYQGHFMARDYVTIREEEIDGHSVWTFTSIGRGRLKSAPARITKSDTTYTVMGAAWGAPIAEVEVRIDDGEWQKAVLSEGGETDYSWTFWTLDWTDPAPGEHTVTSRAIDTSGAVQPAPDDPFLTGKSTFWEANGQITRHVMIA